MYAGYCLVSRVQVVDGDPVTGLQLHQKITAAVYQLRGSGVVPGDRVLITMTPSIDFFALAVATFSLGEQESRKTFRFWVSMYVQEGVWWFWTRPWDWREPTTALR